MKKKIFKTRSQRRKADFVVILIVSVVIAVNLVPSLTEVIHSIQLNEMTLITAFGILLARLVEILSFLLPVLLIYIVIRINENKHKRKNTTFEAVNDIEYYRNDFGEICPALISLMADFEIENKKDIAAMLLYYKLNNIVEVVNKDIVINQNANLTDEDKSFFKWFKSRNETDLIEWKKNIKAEAINQGYIEKESNGYMGCLTPIILFITLFIMLVFIFCFVISVVPHDNIDMLMMALIIPTVIVTFILGNSFWLSIVYFIADIFNRKNIKRTKKGHEFTEKIYAMKNFIHDFGNLSQATKDSLCLWEYFLIYAVVLEENDAILDEIKGYYNQDFINLLSSTDKLG